MFKLRSELHGVSGFQQTCYSLPSNEHRCEKTVFGVSDQVRHKPSCTATEDG